MPDSPRKIKLCRYCGSSELLPNSECGYCEDSRRIVFAEVGRLEKHWEDLVGKYCKSHLSPEDLYARSMSWLKLFVEEIDYETARQKNMLPEYLAALNALEELQSCIDPFDEFDKIGSCEFWSPQSIEVLKDATIAAKNLGLNGYDQNILIASLAREKYPRTSVLLNHRLNTSCLDFVRAAHEGRWLVFLKASGYEGDLDSDYAVDYLIKREAHELEADLFDEKLDDDVLQEYLSEYNVHENDAPPLSSEETLAAIVAHISNSLNENRFIEPLELLKALAVYSTIEWPESNLGKLLLEACSSA